MLGVNGYSAQMPVDRINVNSGDCPIPGFGFVGAIPASLDFLNPADRKPVPARFGHVERRHLVIAPAEHRHRW